MRRKPVLERVKNDLVVLAVLAATCLPLFANPPATIAPRPSLDTLKSPQANALRSTLEKSNYQFSPELRSAYIALAEIRAVAELKEAGITLPADFLTWIDSAPDLQATVYGARQNASDVLRILRSLELDLGQEVVRRRYTQLALANAVVHAREAASADLSERPPLKLVIAGDPRNPVNTKDPSRPLDLNDHIINFLNDHAPIEEEVVIGHREELPELKYDDKGVAIPTKAKPKRVPVKEMRKRPITAADVMASKGLQDDFNAYMKEKGCDVRIDCGDRVIHRNRTEMIRGPEAPPILAAYRMFRAAYEAKGLLPAQRDPKPTPAQKIAFLIRNDAIRFPAEVNRPWPRFPLTAPWPVMTLLAADTQPLRECEDIWLRFRDRGELHTYGEYIGGIAQQFDFQSARRLSPFPFTYGTFQMMLKDGGVCGTMANIAVRSYLTLGIPATTAGQPGHCALVSYAHDLKTNTYVCRGGQYATGGDDNTHPHTPWYFGDVDARRDMVYHQSIAWAINAGLQSYLDSTIAYQVHRLLPESDRKTKGLMLLESGIKLNPYNFLLVDAAQSQAAIPQEQIRVWQTFRAALTAASKPGCPADGLYPRLVKSRLFNNLAKVPVPADRQAATDVQAFLTAESCDVPAAIVAYQHALQGLPALLANTEAQFTQRLLTTQTRSGRDNEIEAARLAQTIQATADRISDKNQRKQWAIKLRQQQNGHEKYFGNKHQVITDPSAPVLARLSGQKLPSEAEMLQPLMTRLSAELAASIAGERNLQQCRDLSSRIAATARVVADRQQLRRWLDDMSNTMAGQETFLPKDVRPGSKPQRDPCADTIGQLRAALPAAG